MTLKNSIRLYEILDKLYLAGVFLIIIGVVVVITKGAYNFLLFGFGIAALLLKFFRKKIFYAALLRSKYKSAFVSVVNKLGEDGIDETFHSDFSFYQNLPVNYSTEEFINDNKLNTIIEKKRDKTPFLSFSTDEIKVDSKPLTWSSIVDWSYYHGSSYTISVPTRIEIEYRQDSVEKARKEYIEPDTLNASHIDILLLLYHFKKTYG